MRLSENLSRAPAKASFTNSRLPITAPSVKYLTRHRSILFSIFRLEISGRVLPQSGRWPVAMNEMEKNDNNATKLAKIEGVWHFFRKSPRGYFEWVPVSELRFDLADGLKHDSHFRFADAMAFTVDDLRDLVNVCLPIYFVADSRGDAEAIASEEIRRRVVCETNDDVVKVAVHIFLENV